MKFLKNKINKFLEKKSQNKIENKKAGFSLLEMLTVLAIFGIMTSITIFNYGDFNSNIVMTNLAYEVALSIREAQVFSLGVRASGTGVDQFNKKYGVYFDIDSDNSKFNSFTDGDNNLICNNGQSQCDIETCTGECTSSKTMTRGVTIQKICVSDSYDPIDFVQEIPTCETEGNSDDLEKLAITFERPSPRPQIVDPDVYNHSDPNSPGKYENAGIILETTNGSSRAIIIRETGQISVEFLNN